MPNRPEANRYREGIAMPRHQRTSTPAPSHAVTSEPNIAPDTATRARSLVVCRESNQYDCLLLEGLLEQTFAYLDLASVPTARLYGILPLTDPGQLPPDVPVITLVEGKTRASLMEIDGDYYLYSMASAAKFDERGNNEFTTLLCRVLERLRPLDMYAATHSRLVRGLTHGANLSSAVARHVDRVHAGTTTMDMRGGDRSVGHLLWTMLSMIASSERDLIVQRTSAGKVNQYSRGEWIQGNNSVPLGYQLTGKTLVVDPEQTELLNLAWTLMADPNLSSTEIVMRLAARGVSTPRTRKDGETIAELVGHHSWIQTQLWWADLYMTGKYTMRFKNPFPGAEHLAGCPVLYEIDESGVRDEIGVLEFDYDFGRPNLDPALITAAVRARRTSRPTGGAAKSHVPALNGLRWIADGIEYRLAGATRGMYALRALGDAERSDEDSIADGVA
ncbi:recombinase family protein [Nocardioides sp. GY 10113]|uniref:recombinase family protein n=1 Tax=Nocardioides sp. GY 10113 TaxID=2569761 RepID=UPI0010A87456|nr:recombinase family protein [Nocardioides sp. GY 10113]TIC86712.1 recombinase family protein [Nocardioides sp. GY 10113]